MTKHLFGAFSEPLRRTVSDRAFESPFGEGSPISFRATRGSDKNSRFAFVRPPPLRRRANECLPRRRTRAERPLLFRDRRDLLRMQAREASGRARLRPPGASCRRLLAQRILPRFKAPLGVCRPSGSRTCPIGPSAPSEHAQNRFWRVCVGYVSPFATLPWPARPLRRLPRRFEPLAAFAFDHCALKGFCRVLRPY